MAVYKVPQDVEADDKLLGPFSFRQFIYLIVVAASIAIAWVLAQIFIGLALIPLPIIFLFGALALPLRKDQPMETYLAAIVSFYLKPRRRLWDPDGQQALVEITAPRVAEPQRTKDLSQAEAEQRLSYLADLVDSRGWSVRGVQEPQANTAMNTDVYNEAQQAEDVLDASTRTAHLINSQLDQAAVKHRQDIITQMQHPQPMAPVAMSQPTTLQPAADDSSQDNPHLDFNPYPSSMHQSVIQPLSAQPASEPKSSTKKHSKKHSDKPAAPPKQDSPKPPSEEPLSPDIISLANNPDLSIETIAHEANRIKQKEGLPEDEVVISLH